MAILYSSEDEVLCEYITANWAAIDALSGECCDIYPSLLQLSDEEDAYSAIDDFRTLPGGKYISISKLPITMLWSDAASACISLREFSHDKHALTLFFRGLFQYLREIKRGINADDEGQLFSVLEVKQA